jgi:hypothetical protein
MKVVREWPCMSDPEVRTAIAELLDSGIVGEYWLPMLEEDLANYLDGRIANQTWRHGGFHVVNIDGYHIELSMGDCHKDDEGHLTRPSLLRITSEDGGISLLKVVERNGFLYITSPALEPAVNYLRQYMDERPYSDANKQVIFDVIKEHVQDCHIHMESISTVNGAGFEFRIKYTRGIDDYSIQYEMRLKTREAR